MQGYRSLSNLTAITDRLLRNRQILATCSIPCDIQDALESFQKPFQPHDRCFSTGPAAEPEHWQEKGIRGAKAFDIALFPQEKARIPSFMKFCAIFINACVYRIYAHPLSIAYQCLNCSIGQCLTLPAFASCYSDTLLY